MIPAAGALFAAHLLHFVRQVAARDAQRSQNRARLESVALFPISSTLTLTLTFSFTFAFTFTLNSTAILGPASTSDSR